MKLIVPIVVLLASIAVAIGSCSVCHRLEGYGYHQCLLYCNQMVDDTCKTRIPLDPIACREQTAVKQMLSGCRSECDHAWR